MKKYKGVILVGIGLMVWIIETAHFGWNETPQTPPEHVLDTISWLMIIWGVLTDVAQGVQKVTNITTNKVEIIKNKAI